MERSQRRHGGWGAARLILGAFVIVLVSAAVVTTQSLGTWALRFSNDDQGAAGPEVDTTYDRMSFEAALNWSGPRSTASGIQTAVYQGNSALCGWGIMIAAGNPGFLQVGAPAGSVGILVGGNAILFSPDTLVPGTWQTVRASIVIVGDDAFYRVQVGNNIPHDILGPAPNSAYSCPGRWMQIGSGSDLFNLGAPSPDPFNGMIDSVTVANAESGSSHHFLIEEGTGAAQTADEHGDTMTLVGTPEWVGRVVTPTINSITPDRSTIWPPNNKMVPVTLAISASGGSGLKAEVASVTSNENAPFQTSNNGPVNLSAAGTGTLTVNLQASRLGSGSGRVYTITVKVMNSTGGSSTKPVTVTVPHDQGK